MKNLKNHIILGIIGIILIVGTIIYYNQNNNYDEITYENLEKEEEIKNNNEIIVHIIGEVKNPGVIKITEKSRVLDVVELAGGLTEDADVDKINLAAIVSDGQKIKVPNKDDNQNNYEEEIIGNNILI